MTTTVHQHFHGDIHGLVAGRDIEHVCPQLCRAVSRYEQRAMDLLPACCHDELAAVIRHSDCSARDIYHACRTWALGCKDGRLVRRHAALDYTMGGVLLLAAVVIFLLVALTVLNLWGHPVPSTMHLQLGGVTIGGIAVGAVATSQLIGPQLTARKAVRVLGRASNNRKR